MAQKKLQNYLRTYRKRSGLSQSELVYLLGCKSTSKSQVYRYECFRNIPSLKTALEYEAVLGVPVAELFAGMYQQAEKAAAKRARALMRRLEKSTSNRKNTRKADLLRAIAITPQIKKENS